MTEYVGRGISPASFTAVLAVIFAGLALLLAATGIYGVFNYQVSRRLPEMGTVWRWVRVHAMCSAWCSAKASCFVATGVLLGVVAAFLQRAG